MRTVNWQIGSDVVQALMERRHGTLLGTLTVDQLWAVAVEVADIARSEARQAAWADPEVAKMYEYMRTHRGAVWFDEGPDAEALVGA